MSSYFYISLPSPFRGFQLFLYLSTPFPDGRLAHPPFRRLLYSFYSYCPSPQHSTSIFIHWRRARKTTTIFLSWCNFVLKSAPIPNRSFTSVKTSRTLNGLKLQAYSGTAADYCKTPFLGITNEGACITETEGSLSITGAWACCPDPACTPGRPSRCKTMEKEDKKFFIPKESNLPPSDKEKVFYTDKKAGLAYMKTMTHSEADHFFA